MADRLHLLQNHPLGLEIFGQLACDVDEAVVAEQPRLVAHMCLVVNRRRHWAMIGTNNPLKSTIVEGQDWDPIHSVGVDISGFGEDVFGNIHAIAPLLICSVYSFSHRRSEAERRQRPI
ncbi:hypothetical protein [Sphingomonas sp. KC8]|uniref:hypothetical protein n=1 Tax=Sphingomonas sp. KC8 TaxID=1030157 RepID=UPI00178C66F0|nr:hypothetical protein [Sphingomonas sp. KC8]